METEVLVLQDEYSSFFLVQFAIESCDSCRAGNGKAWKVDGRAQALVGPGLAMPLSIIAEILNKIKDQIV